MNLSTSYGFVVYSLLHGLNDGVDLVALVASPIVWHVFLFVVDACKVIKHKPYDHKVDVFSFGVLQWELLTGKVMCHFVGSDNECRWRKYNSLQKITLLYLQKYMVAQTSYLSSCFLTEMPAPVWALYAITSSSWCGSDGIPPLNVLIL